jgi:hypothetical protein
MGGVSDDREREPIARELLTTSQGVTLPEQLATTIQMCGAQLLVQIRTRVLNNEPEDLFRQWYPAFRKAA